MSTPVKVLLWTLVAILVPVAVVSLGLLFAFALMFVVALCRLHGVAVYCSVAAVYTAVAVAIGFFIGRRWKVDTDLRDMLRRLG